MANSLLDLPSSLNSSHLDATHFQHTPFYCEENVYLLCKKLCSSGIAASEGSDLFVTFITNENKQVPLWNQKASRRADGMVLWDYHVICIQTRKEGQPSHLVWDLDSTLPFPTPLPTYIKETFQPSFALFSEFQRLFRIIHAPTFIRSFASDRRHMKDPSGNWNSEPPAYESIVAEDGCVHNLNEYLDISTTEVVENVGAANSLNAEYTEKLGVLVEENRLEEIISSLSHCHC
ncbi:protein N-terminal glutamine amidohydrolase [Impatiens glandulifera]|uniref:protein N-terminal glutamine amidohydrolase n=1 Tax=Impatiens glandulifera TaxID=253017 RepID=UPI001FB1316C|nr:protein N-terminal glutamine amidohydrolase [Impatiens glandulifera]